MRTLTRHPEPAILSQNHATWTAEYVAARNRGENPRGNWGHDEIRAALHAECSGRCAYCEAFVSHVAYEHVEHVRPKSAFPELAHMWDNLTTACQVCNTRKGTYFDPADPLLTPFDDDLVDHVGFYGGMHVPKQGSRRMQRTIDKVGLNRLDLVAARERRLLSVARLLAQWQAATGGEKETLAAAISLDAEEGEFPSAVYALLTWASFPVAAND